MTTAGERPRQLPLPGGLRPASAEPAGMLAGVGGSPGPGVFSLGGDPLEPPDEVRDAGLGPASAEPPGSSVAPEPPGRASLGARVLMACITGYRRYVSPLSGPHCRFEPSCSAYALEAVRRHGAVRGLWLAVRRIARCHPFHPGGFDPVPPATRHRWTARSEGASS